MKEQGGVGWPSAIKRVPRPDIFRLITSNQEAAGLFLFIGNTRWRLLLPLRFPQHSIARVLTVVFSMSTKLADVWNTTLRGPYHYSDTTFAYVI